MIGLSPSSTEPLRVLLLGAHADDIEIGCGGTVLRLAASGRPLDVLWIVFSGDAARRREAAAGAERFLAGVRSKEVLLWDFRDGFFPAEAPRVKERFEQVKARFSPDVIFTHRRDDAHQDHRVVSELTWNTWRSHMILEYEIPKYDGDLGQPNLFVPLDEATVASKVGHILETFETQAPKGWFTDDTFRALLRLRGVECASETRFAEAFHVRKAIFQP